MMRIKCARVYRVRLPMATSLRIAYAEIAEADVAYVEIETDNGVVGCGEAAPSPRVTGESISQAAEALSTLDRVLGTVDILDVGAVEDELLRAFPGSPAARAAASMAVYDVLGKVCGQPLRRLLGSRRAEVETDVTIGIKGVEETVSEALAWRERGFGVFKLKVGLDEEADVERVKRLRDQLGGDVRIRVDANQAWSPKRAVRVIARLERYDIELVEQPVPAWDVEGLKFVRERVGVPVIADESVMTAVDAARLASIRAVDGFNIKLMKCGGIGEALKIARVAEAFGLACMIGCMAESRLALTAAAHVACSSHAIAYVDLDSSLFLKEEPIKGGIAYSGSRIALPSGPGLGAELDKRALKTP